MAWEPAAKSHKHQALSRTVKRFAKWSYSWEGVSNQTVRRITCQWSICNVSIYNQTFMNSITVYKVLRSKSSRFTAIWGYSNNLAVRLNRNHAACCFNTIQPVWSLWLSSDCIHSHSPLHRADSALLGSCGPRQLCGPSFRLSSLLLRLGPTSSMPE